MRLSSLTLAVFAAACGRVAYDSVTPASTDGAGSIDSPGLDAPSGPDAPAGFGPPRLVAELSSGNQVDDPSVRFDGLEIFFVARTTTLHPGDIMTARRATLEDAWGTPTFVTEVNSTVDDGSPELSSDGLTLWISSERLGGPGSKDAWVSTRPRLETAWSSPVLVPELCSSAVDGAPADDASGMRVVFDSERFDGSRDILEATRSSGSTPWNAPVSAAELNTAYDEAVPFSPDPGSIFFASNRPGGAGGRDLYVATRPDPGGPFGAPTAIWELNSGADDTDPWLSPDGRTLYFSSDVTGDRAIYEASR